MPKRVTSFVACLGALALSGCGIQLQRAEQMPAQGSEFDRNLYQGYVDLARAEFDEGDYRDSDSFAERAIASAQGEVVLPETVQERRLPEAKQSELSQARERLIAVLDGGAREAQPADAARGQTLFECWIQEQEEDLESADIAACRDGFFEVLDTLEAAKAVAAAGSKPAPAPTPTPAPQAEPEPKITSTALPAPTTGSEGATASGEAGPGTFIVFFDFDTASLSEETEAILSEVVRAASEAKSMTIVAAGHADLTGPAEYNADLARRRADAVVRYLIESGIEKPRVKSRSFGESKPLIETEDEVEELQNRRVEIQFLKNPEAN